MLDQPYQYGLDSTRGIWRELAMEHLPDFRDVILAATSHVDFWWSIKELLSDAGTSEAQRTKVQSIYDYAWWCVALSGNEDLATEVGTYFYEDLSVFSDFGGQVPKFVTLSQFERLEQFFRYCLSDDEYAIFRSRFLAQCGESDG
jgi:hypothetical protein